MRVKGIKRGKNIEIFEELNIPDGQEVTIAIETKGSFWESLQRFRQELESEGIWIEPEVFEGIRDSSPGRELSTCAKLITYRTDKMSVLRANP